MTRAAFSLGLILALHLVAKSFEVPYLKPVDATWRGQEQFHLPRPPYEQLHVWMPGDPPGSTLGQL